jgi:hypothetical protein
MKQWTLEVGVRGRCFLCRVWWRRRSGGERPGGGLERRPHLLAVVYVLLAAVWIGVEHGAWHMFVA